MLDQLNEAAEHLYPEKEQTDKPQQTPEAQESQKESNMRILRERAEAAERRALELERTIQMNMSQQQSNRMEIVDSEDDSIGISDDTYVEGKDLKKYVKVLRKELKETKKQFEEYNQQQSLTQAEMRLKSQFTDFDAVVSKENLKKLADQKPALLRTIYANTDIYDRGFAAYELIKSSGIAESYDSLEKRVEDNRNKPRSAANASPQTGETPLTRVGDYDRRILTEERKDQLRRQVEQAKMYKQ